jgi:hypothetical protein
MDLQVLDDQRAYNSLIVGQCARVLVAENPKTKALCVIKVLRE